MKAINLVPTSQVPEATADPTAHADWMELSALSSLSCEASAQDLIAAIRRTGSSDAILDVDESEEDWVDSQYVGGHPRLDDAVEKEDQELERIADDAFEQLGRREEYLGEQYPFTLGNSRSVLKSNTGAVDTAYAFLAAVTSLAWKNKTAPASAASLFELLSAAALVSYLGGEDTARSYHFGFPRRTGPPGFRDAVNDLCQQMGEGGGCRTDRPKAADVKDAKLDLVAWIPFGDGRSNQLSVFGQCATGDKWRGKINELQPIDFCKMWLKEQPAMSPSLAFFVPRDIMEDNWPEAAIGDRRLVFDRLRIARMLGQIDAKLARICATWTASALR